MKINIPKESAKNGTLFLGCETFDKCRPTLYNAVGQKIGLIFRQGTGGDKMTALETITLLNLIAVIVFGVINSTKK